MPARTVRDVFLLLLGVPMRKLKKDKLHIFQLDN